MLLSKCCEARYKVVGGDEGTNHWECRKCEQACDVIDFCDHAHIEPDWDFCPYCGKPFKERDKQQALDAFEAEATKRYMGEIQ